MTGSCGRGPKSIWIAIKSKFVVRIRFEVLCGEIGSVVSGNGFSEFFQSLHVRVGQESATIGSDAENELSAATNRLIVG